jgi:hypothetical protein
MECCREGTCTPAACSELECGFDPICEFSCGTCSAGYHCEYGQCVPDSTGDLCPTGQDCYVVAQSGIQGCLIPPDVVPSGNQTGCGPDSPCNGNYSCYAADDAGATVCIQHCGTCPAGQTCWDVFGGGQWLCLTSSGAIPPNAPACGTDNSCTGNASCYQETSTGNLICINHCSSE